VGLEKTWISEKLWMVKPHLLTIITLFVLDEWDIFNNVIGKLEALESIWRDNEGGSGEVGIVGSFYCKKIGHKGKQV
jgi:hypothetical protein